MQKNSGYLRGTLVALFAVATLVSGVWLHSWIKERNGGKVVTEYESVAMVSSVNGVTITSNCTNAESKFSIGPNQATFSFNGDTMSGIPVKMTEDGGIVVQFSATLYLIFYKIPENSEGNELLIVLNPGQTLIFSQTKDCEDIAAFVDKAQR